MVAVDYDSFCYYTYSDYLGWEGSWELIDGVAYAISPTPHPKHQKVVALAWKELDANLDCSYENCEVYVSPVDWKVDETTVVQPDIALFCEEPEGQFFPKHLLLWSKYFQKQRHLKMSLQKKSFMKSREFFFI